MPQQTENDKKLNKLKPSLFQFGIVWYGGWAKQVGWCHNKGATMQKYENMIIQKNQRCKKYKKYKNLKNTKIDIWSKAGGWLPQQRRHLLLGLSPVEHEPTPQQCQQDF